MDIKVTATIPDEPHCYDCDFSIYDHDDNCFCVLFQEYLGKDCCTACLKAREETKKESK